MNKIRSIHPCNLCDEESFEISGASKAMCLGASEIWVPCGDKYFAAPSMILHYIEVHNYRPPVEFVDAVKAMDLSLEYSGQKVYDQLIKARM